MVKATVKAAVKFLDVFRSGRRNSKAKWTRVEKKGYEEAHWKRRINSYDPFVEEICPTVVDEKRQRQMRLNAMLPEESWVKVYKEYLFQECLVHLKDMMIEYYKFMIFDWFPDEILDAYFRVTTIVKCYDAGKREGFGWHRFNRGYELALKHQRQFYHSSDIVQVCVVDAKNLGFM